MEKVFENKTYVNLEQVDNFEIHEDFNQIHDVELDEKDFIFKESLIMNIDTQKRLTDFISNLKISTIPVDNNVNILIDEETSRQITPKVFQL